MAYKAGVPQVKSYNPPRPPRAEDISPATQGGTVDPLTALFAVLRTVPEAEACMAKLVMFDGRRRSQVVLTAPQRTDDGITCRGEYRRLEGFSPEDMAEKSRFPFTLTYRAAGDGNGAGRGSQHGHALWQRPHDPAIRSPCLPITCPLTPSCPSFAPR